MFQKVIRKKLIDKIILSLESEYAELKKLKGSIVAEEEIATLENYLYRYRIRGEN